MARKRADRYPACPTVEQIELARLLGIPNRQLDGMNPQEAEATIDAWLRTQPLNWEARVYLNKIAVKERRLAEGMKVVVVPHSEDPHMARQRDVFRIRQITADFEVRLEGKVFLYDPGVLYPAK